LLKQTLGGIYLKDRKGTAGRKPIVVPVPERVYIPMSMSAGKPAKPIINTGDEVKVGELIAEATAFVSANIHSSVSGKVKDISEVDSITGEKSITIIIETDGKQTLYENLQPPVISDYESFLKAVRDSGVVGCGGAGFPTDVKLTLKDLKKLDYMLVNGAECEPYITSDHRTMLDETEYFWEGIQNIKKYMNPGKIIICIEENKRNAIKKIKKLCKGKNAKNISVHVLKKIYPQGERKVMVYNVTGRIVPEGARLPDIGCVVINTTTVTIIGKYIKTGMPFVSKCITVDGSAVGASNNVTVPIGTPVRDVLEFCGGLIEDKEDGIRVDKVILGGPMTGTTIPSLDIPVIKTTNAVLAFLEEKEKSKKDFFKSTQITACIKCGKCISTCPVFLSPVCIETAYNLKKREQLKALKVNMCIGCGCCAYSCPARRPLVQVLQLSNDMLWKYKSKSQKEKEKKEAKKST